MRLRLAALFACFALPAAAQTLNVATGGAFTSMDPHYHNLGPNNVLTAYVFDPLVRFDRKYQPEASLAVSWKTVNDTTWEFKLREGVKFQDGTPFTADDVAFTYARVPQVPNSPGSFTFATKAITQVEIVDANTIRLHSATPLPLLAYNLSNVNIVSRKIGENAATSDYNSMKVAIGTGPFRVTEFAVGERAVFERNDSWWGPKPAWARVVYRSITNGASRNAALQTMGNLTILTQALNSSVSNSKWSIKKPALLQHSLLPINQHFYAAPVWDEAAIAARSDDLLKRALTIWPRG